MLLKTRLHIAMIIKGIKRTLRRVPVLKNVMAVIRKREPSDKPPEYDLEIYRSRAALLNKYGIDIRGKVLMDMGCGNNSAHAFEFLAAGAKEFILCELLAKEYFTEKKIKGRLPENKKIYYEQYAQKLRVIDDSVENLKSLPDNSVDIILSTSLLEHVSDPEKAFSEMKRVLKKDGCMFHSIDLRDHFFFDFPLHFLKFSPWWWKHFFTRPETFTNRFRMPYYLDLIEKFGFKIIYQHTESTDQGTNQFGLDERFKNFSEEENRVTHLEFIARRAK